MAPVSLPSWLDGLERLPAYFGVDDQRWAAPFRRAPDLLAVHSAAEGNWPAEFLHDPQCKPPKGRVCKDGVRRTVAAAHVSWYEGRTNKLRRGVEPPSHGGQFVQQTPLDHEAPGAGGSRCQGLSGVNARAVHVELPARLVVRSEWDALMALLLPALPSLRYWTMHRVIDPANKRDPVAGSGFEAGWMAGTGLVYAGRD